MQNEAVDKLYVLLHLPCLASHSYTSLHRHQRHIGSDLLMRVHECILCGHFFVCLSVHIFLHACRRKYAWPHQICLPLLVTMAPCIPPVPLGDHSKYIDPLHPLTFHRLCRVGLYFLNKIAPCLFIARSHSSLRYYLQATDKRKTGVVWKEEAWSRNSKKRKMPGFRNILVIFPKKKKGESTNEKKKQCRLLKAIVSKA